MAHYGGGSSEFTLSNPPADCIQSVKFGQIDNQHILAASWDCSVRLYDVKANQPIVQYNHDGPVFDAVFQGNNYCWSGGADKKVKCFDFQSQNETTVGYHDEPVKCVEYIQNLNLVATGGWDKQLKLWDPRLCDSNRQTSIAKHVHPEKIYTMSVCGDKLIVGTAGRFVMIWDLRNMSHVQRESILKYQIRCVEAFADRTGYVVGSIEGRVAVEYFDPSPEAQAQKYAFKCHRSKDPTTGLELIYPVNTISFHQKYNTFATGGADGFVSVWDSGHKKRLVQFHRYPTSISSLSFSPDGSMLAIACSHLNFGDEADGLGDMRPNNIFIRRINDHEVRNKGTTM